LIVFFSINTTKECQKVSGSTDINQPYVQFVNKRKSTRAICGHVIKIRNIPHYNYLDL